MTITDMPIITVDFSGYSDETDLTDHADWDLPASLAATYPGYFTLTSGVVYGGIGPNQSGAFFQTALGASDNIYVEASLDPIGTNADAGVLIGSDNSTGEHYRLAIASSGFVRLGKKAPGETELNESDETYAFLQTSPCTLRLERSGGMLHGYLNGQHILSHYDDEFTGGEYVGIWADDDGTDREFHSVEAGTFTDDATWTLVQSQSRTANSGDPDADSFITLAKQPTEGNQLIAFAASRPGDFGEDAPDVEVQSDDGSLWDLVATDGTTNHTLAIYSRIAQAGEDVDISILSTGNDATDFQVQLGVMEFSGPLLDAADILVEQNSGGASSTTVTATTDTLAKAPALAFAFATVRQSSSRDFPWEDSSSYDGPERQPFGDLECANYICASGYEEVSTTSALTYKATCGSSAETAMLVVTFAQGGDGGPGAIDDLSATPGDTQVVLTWTAPVDGASAITDYEYRVDGGTWTSISSSTPGFTVTALTNDTEYDFEVRAVNSIGEADASNLVSSTPSVSSFSGSYLKDSSAIKRALVDSSGQNASLKNSSGERFEI